MCRPPYRCGYLPNWIRWDAISFLCYRKKSEGKCICAYVCSIKKSKFGISVCLELLFHIRNFISPVPLTTEVAMKVKHKIIPFWKSRRHSGLPQGWFCIPPHARCLESTSLCMIWKSFAVFHSKAKSCQLVLSHSLNFDLLLGEK